MAFNKGQIQIERRSNHRYPVDAVIEYRAVDGKQVRTGRGRTLNLSSTGVLFESSGDLASGLEVEIFIQWPVPIGNSGALQLHAIGQTVRSLSKACAVRIQQSEFRPQYQ